MGSIGAFLGAFRGVRSYGPGPWCRVMGQGQGLALSLWIGLSFELVWVLCWFGLLGLVACLLCFFAVSFLLVFRCALFVWSGLPGGLDLLRRFGFGFFAARVCLKVVSCLGVFAAGSGRLCFALGSSLLMMLAWVGCGFPRVWMCCSICCLLECCELPAPYALLNEFLSCELSFWLGVCYILA
ncbi:hypothetical protein U1Q18_001356 [Sarracenia purpurea var. burkii]